MSVIIKPPCSSGKITEEKFLDYNMPTQISMNYFLEKNKSYIFFRINNKLYSIDYSNGVIDYVSVVREYDMQFNLISTLNDTESIRKASVLASSMYYYKDSNIRYGKCNVGTNPGVYKVVVPIDATSINDVTITYITSNVSQFGYTYYFTSFSECVSDDMYDWTGVLYVDNKYVYVSTTDAKYLCKIEKSSGTVTIVDYLRNNTCYWHFAKLDNQLFLIGKSYNSELNGYGNDNDQWRMYNESSESFNTIYGTADHMATKCDGKETFIFDKYQGLFKTSTEKLLTVIYHTILYQSTSDAGKYAHKGNVYIDNDYIIFSTLHYITHMNNSDQELVIVYKRK